MAKQSNQKAKLLYLQKILTEETDSAHGITIAGIVEKLAEAGIAAERKSLYDDVEVLRSTGMNIETIRGRSNSYKLISRTPDAAAVLKIGRALQAAGEENTDAVMQGLYALLSKYEAEAVKAELASAPSAIPAEIVAQDAAEITPVQAKPAKETARTEADAEKEKSAPEAEKAADVKPGKAANADGKDKNAAESIELKCAAELQDAVLAYLGAGAKIVKVKSSGVVIKAKAVINEDFYAQLIKWGGVKLSEPSERRKEFKKYCKKIFGQYK